LTAGTFVAGPLLLGQNSAPPAPPISFQSAITAGSYRDLVKAVAPAVVSIEARAKVARAQRTTPNNKRGPRTDQGQLPDQFRRQVPEEFRRFFEDFNFKNMPFDELPENPSPQKGFGSGFLVDPSGVVLTNYHVVDGADQVTVELNDGRKFVSKDIHADKKTDLAVVRISPRDGKALPYLQLGDSEAMQIGDRVLAFGAPFGLTGSVTQGIVSGKGRTGFGMNMYEDFLQTDAAINPGNSGGPLVSLDGKVVGINSMIKSRSGGFQGVGLAIASNLARNIMNALIKDGAVHRGYLGVQIRDLSEDVAEHLGLKGKHGVVVGKVFEGSPAGKAGLQAGDVITAINGKGVKDGRQLQTVVAGLPLHKAVPVDVLRDGQKRDLQVTIEEQPNEFGTVREATPTQPEQEQPALAVDKIGVDVADLTPQLAQELGYKVGTKGAAITRVDSNSVAWEAGLKRGMLIAKVDNQRVETATAARDALQRGSLERGVLLQVQSPEGGTNYVLLQQRSAAAGS
jgi:serine protease Do